MKKIIGAYILLIVLAIAACTKATEDPIRPLSIQAFLPNSVNTINGAKALPSGGFILNTQHNKLGKTFFYKFSNDLQLIDSGMIIGHNIREMEFDDEGNIMVLSQNLWDGYFDILKMNSEFEVIASRRLDDVAPYAPRFRYWPKIIRLKNQTYVIAYTDNQENPQQNKVVLFGMDDPMNDANPKWVTNPSNYTDEWIQELEPTEDGGIMVTGYDHSNRTYMFISKYNSEGDFLWKKTFSLEDGETHQASEVNGKFVYTSKTRFYSLGQNGQVELVKFHDKADRGYPVSRFVGSGGNLYCAKDYANSDGFFLGLYKFNDQFELLDSTLYGNRGTNLKNNADYDKRWLIKLSNGDMVSLNLVEKPGLNGNNWLFVKFDPDLQLID